MTVTALIALLNAQTAGNRAVIQYPPNTNEIKDVEAVEEMWSGITVIKMKPGAEST